MTTTSNGAHVAVTLSTDPLTVIPAAAIERDRIAQAEAGRIRAL